MKKLITAAVIVCAAAFTQAASIDWGMDYMEDPDGGNEGYYGYLLIADGNMTGWSTYAIDSAAADLAKGDASFLTTYALQDASGVNAFAIDYGAATVTQLGYKNGETVLDKNQTVQGYLIIADSDDVSKITKACLVAVNGDGEPVVAPINNSGASDGFAFGAPMDVTTDGDNWHAISSAPEPTSGLLLLLGVAGLALRRRRA